MDAGEVGACGGLLLHLAEDGAGDGLGLGGVDAELAGEGGDEIHGRLQGQEDTER